MQIHWQHIPKQTEKKSVHWQTGESRQQGLKDIETVFHSLPKVSSVGDADVGTGETNLALLRLHLTSWRPSTLNYYFVNFFSFPTQHFGLAGGSWQEKKTNS